MQPELAKAPGLCSPALPMRIRAFQGLRPEPVNAAKVAALPYDVVSTEEARELAKGNPLSFLHISRAEIDLPEGTNPYSDAVYEQSLANLQKLIQDNILVRESEPCVYLYQQRLGNHTQTGLTAVCHIEDYENNVIKKHEKTRKTKEDDRTRLNRTLSCHPGPVFLTYRDEAKVNSLVDEALKLTPLLDFTAPDGVGHTLWRVPGGQAYVEAFQNIPVSYVADGHHRSASAARVGHERREANHNHTGEEDYNWFPAVLFPASQLNILPYNRLVKDLNGLSPADLLARLKGIATLSENAKPAPTAPGEVSLYLGGQWYGLTFAEDAAEGPIERLDVSRLQDKILSPLLGIGDPRTDERMDFVGGIRGTAELEKRVNSGDWACAFSLYPVTVDQLMDIADAGEIMPPKSTWFEPKLRSGLFIHTF